MFILGHHDTGRHSQMGDRLQWRSTKIYSGLEHITCKKVLRELNLFSPRYGRLRGYLIDVFSYIKGSYRKDRARLLLEVHREWVRCSGYKLQREKLLLMSGPKCAFFSSSCSLELFKAMSLIRAVVRKVRTNPNPGCSQTGLLKSLSKVFHILSLEAAFREGSCFQLQPELLAAVFQLWLCSTTYPCSPNYDLHP